ncbi:MAG: alpha/beta fold hydrolase [Chitinophagaceae bacterium]
MEKPTIKQNIRSVLRWAGWVLLVQFLLLNISAALYAYKFTHFYKSAPVVTGTPDENIFGKTWRLFAGQRLPKSVVEDYPSFSFDTVTLETKNGGSLDAWYSKADSSAKGTVILFHGLTMNKGKILLEASEFRYLGYNVLLVDFRGHGNSEGYTTTIGYLESEEVKLAYDHLVQQGEKHIFLWGTSMGAAAIVKSIADNDMSPAGVILEMPFNTLQSHLRSRARAIGFRGFPEKPFGFLVTAWVGIERGFNGFGFRVSNYAKKVNCPVLYQWGALDHSVLRNETDKVYNAIASVNKKLVIYEQADHESFLQKDPVKWRMEVDRFLTANTH